MTQEQYHHPGTTFLYTGSAPILPTYIYPSLHFTRMLIRTGLRNPANLITSVITPVFLSIMFALTMGTGEDSMLISLFPGIIIFVIVMAGAMLAAQLVIWRNQGIFQRLACTPIPVGYLAFGAAIAQLIVNILQSLIVIAFGAVILGIPISPVGLLWAIPAFFFGGLCFLAYGVLIAAFVNSPQVAYPLYMFTIMPLLFLGGTLMPLDIFPPIVQSVGRMMPTSLLSQLVSMLFSQNVDMTQALVSLMGLAFYTLVLSAIGIRFFRTTS